MFRFSDLHWFPKNRKFTFLFGDVLSKRVIFVVAALASTLT